MGELLVLLSVYYKFNFIFFIIIIFTILFCTIFCIWLFSKICFGTLQLNYNKDINYDLTINELVILVILSLNIIFFGIFPGFILNFLM